MMIMICLRCTLGGAEKQYARVFEMLVESGGRHKLVINRSMLALLQSAGLLADHHAYFIVLDPPFRHRIGHRQRPYRVVRITSGLASVLDTCWFAWKCWRVIRFYKPAIVHPLLTAVYLSLPALLLHRSLAHVLSAYSYQFTSYRDKYILGKPVGASLKLLAFRRSHAIDALTEAIRLDLIERGISGGKILAAPCSFTDLSLCNPDPDKQPWIVFLARFVDIKDPLLLARAIPDVIAVCPDARFFFLGEGDLESELRVLVHELGVEGYTTIRFEPQPTAVLSQSSIFVSLQREENYPSQSLLEAMACANAVVATDVGETWRLVDDSNGIRIPASSDALAKALIALLHDPQLAARQAASRRRVLTEHTAGRFFQHVLQVYRLAAGNSRR